MTNYKIEECNINEKLSVKAVKSQFFQNMGCKKCKDNGIADCLPVQFEPLRI